jgi:hypothetical protein
MVGICFAVERAVEIIKGAIPQLSSDWGKYDQIRAAILQLLAAAVGAAIVSQMPDQVRSAMPPGLAVPLHWPTYAVLGLMTSGGAGAWNHALDILAALKEKQETLTSIVQATGANASVAAPLATGGSTAVGASTLSSTTARASSEAVAPTGFFSLLKSNCFHG